MKREGSTVRGGLPDEEIVALYFEREERAITDTDAKYGSYLYTIAMNILRDHPDAEECMNDTYLGTWNAIPPTRPQILRVFLSKITRNIAIGQIRKREAGKRPPSELFVSLEELDECVCVEAGADEAYLIRRRGEVLNRYLRSRPERKLFVFVCRYYYADPIKRIAGMLGLSENTVLRDRAGLRKGLKECLIKEGYWNE